MAVCRTSRIVQRMNLAKTSGPSVMSIAQTIAPRSQSSSLLPFPPARRLLSSTGILSNTTIPARESTGSSSKQDSATNKAEKTRQRFWKSVDVVFIEGPPAPHLVVQLDGRSLKTPGGAILAIPPDRPLLASLIAREWAEQERLIRTHSLSMTSLAARAIDGLETQWQRDEVCDELIKYLDTETICFHEKQPPVLVQLQEQRWKPILEWAATRFEVPPVRTFDGIFGVEQDPKVIQKLRYHIGTFNGWDLAALERAIRSTKSFLVGLRLVDAIQSGRDEDFTVEEACLAAEVEVESQTERWGEVEDTHDVDHADLRKTLASTACAVVRDTPDVAQSISRGHKG